MALSTMGRHLLQQTSRSLHCRFHSSTLPTEFAPDISRSLCSTKAGKGLFHPRLLDQLVQRSSTAFPLSGSSALLGKVHVRSMSSDADYAAFLDKANQSTGSVEAKEASQKKSYGTKSVNTAVPGELKQVEEYYISDSDEPFEPVALEFSGSSVSSEDLAKLLGTDKVEEVKGTGFESQYKGVVDAVKKAGNGTAKVFRVQLEGTRAEYYVIGVDEKEGRIVGLKALAVES